MGILITISAAIIFILGVLCYVYINLVGIRYATRLMCITYLPIVVLSGLIWIMNVTESRAAEPVVPLVTAEQVCDKYAISYDYVKAVAEKTGQDELRVAYFCTYCDQNNWEVDTALHYMAPGLTSEEINEVIYNY